ncbi:ABC transporter ATP-binding protein [Burkholderia sp. THE68]|uniref:urea ABC transporter ATP-binding protein UrtD n=1 Tax=Burkholderia sp. THE68 TaxID=758782 RepID=UPI0013199C12|nr:urea ABC transporter ATP-binding protein UrtD [Burkholderia sp. THE68]BBU30298.1 ABC transporter ATP-binding protein [Burkholderia sp. THE68]
MQAINAGITPGVEEAGSSLDMLDISDLTVSFGGFKAVNELSLKICERELRVVIGPNGAGKTTLLDLICGKTRATSGSVRFRGIELTEMTEFKIVRAGVGRKFQNPSIYEDLSVRENLEISIPQAHSIRHSLFFRRTAAIRERIDSVAEQIRLLPQLGRKAGLLSHGQKQWLEIGMLLVQNPELLLLDEPVAGMSPKEREQTGELLKQIAATKSLVVIEHDMDFVRSIAQRVTVLHQGRLLADGTVEQVQSDPRVIEVYLGH